MTSAQSITPDQYRSAAHTLRSIRESIQRARSGDVPSQTLLDHSRDTVRTFDRLLAQIAGIGGLDTAREVLTSLRASAQAVVDSRGLVTREELTRRVEQMTSQLDSLIAYATSAADSADERDERQPGDDMPWLDGPRPSQGVQTGVGNSGGNGLGYSTAQPIHPQPQVAPQPYTPVPTEGATLPVIVDGDVRQGVLQTVAGVSIVVVSD
jgi:hypothetical protein